MMALVIAVAVSNISGQVCPSAAIAVFNNNQIAAHMLIVAPSEEKPIEIVMSCTPTVKAFTADELIITGGSVFSIAPVAATDTYLVWVQASYGSGALSIAIKPGLAV